MVGVCHRDIKPQNLLVILSSQNKLFSVSQQSSRVVFSLLITMHAQDEFVIYMQVNPNTHQLKICDFGSAKMLVSLVCFFDVGVK